MTKNVEQTPADPSTTLVVDFAIRIGSWIYVAGWCGNKVSGLDVDTGPDRHGTKAFRHPRPDVTAAYGGALSGDLGFVAAVSGATSSEFPTLRWKIPQGAQALEIDLSDAPPDNFMQSLEPVLHQQIATFETGSPDWVAHQIALPPKTSDDPLFRGAVDGVFTVDGLGSIVSGWLLSSDQVRFVLIEEDGSFHSLDSMYQFPRYDLQNGFDITPAQASRAGFIAYLDSALVKASGLFAITEEGAIRLANTPVSKELPANSRSVAKTLFGLETPMTEFSERAMRIDWAILAPLIARERVVWETCEVTGADVGPQPEAPEVTLIIPLYGRFDFVEHQLMEFSRDPYMKTRAEILYVVDDPVILERFKSEVAELFDLYRQPFRWIWGSVNRGFSGANNLGMSHARAARLLFMNSDIFPREPGWLERMVAALDSHPTLGVVTPRLLFANGGMQHSGMKSRRLDALGVWINHHPNLGLDPEFDPHKDLDAVELATGACMLMRREEIERLGGWDTGYLIGDFEDSDLCFKYRDAGLDIGYLPTVSLVHLERQSFSNIGTNSFKHKVMIANSVRHASRWPQFLHDHASN